MAGLAVALLCLAQDPVATKSSKPAIDLRVDVVNFYMDAKKTIWAGGSWEIACPDGRDVASVHLRLRPRKGGEKRELVGEMPRKDLVDFIALQKKEGLFTAKDVKYGGCCDAPVFTVTVRDDEARHAFKLHHNHEEWHVPQRRIVEAIIAEVERLATSDLSAK